MPIAALIVVCLLGLLALWIVVRIIQSARGEIANAPVTPAPVRRFGARVWNVIAVVTSLGAIAAHFANDRLNSAVDRNNEALATAPPGAAIELSGIALITPPALTPVSAELATALDRELEHPWFLPRIDPSAPPLLVSRAAISAGHERAVVMLSPLPATSRIEGVDDGWCRAMAEGVLDGRAILSAEAQALGGGFACRIGVGATEASTRVEEIMWTLQLGEHRGVVTCFLEDESGATEACDALALSARAAG